MDTVNRNKKGIKKALEHACGNIFQKKMLLTGILFSAFLMSSFAQKETILLPTHDSCYVRPPEQMALALTTAGASATLRVAYVIPSNRSPQPDGVANLQYAILTAQRFFKEQMEQNGFGSKTFTFETEPDGVTPLVHVVSVPETDEYLREDLWGRTMQAATNAGISLWAQGDVWVVVPEAHLMLPDATIIGKVALGAGYGTGDGPGVSMIGSNALPFFRPEVLTDDTPYDGKVFPAMGPLPMKQDVTFVWFEGATFSSVASSWLGALWHETGHAFGLAHDFRNDNNFHGNLMANGLRGTRGFLFPEKYPQDYTRLEYTSSLILNVSHYFNNDKITTAPPFVSHNNPGTVIPQNGHVRISFQASDNDSLSLAQLRYNGNTSAELVLDGTSVDTAFSIPHFAKGAMSQYTIVVHDKQGNNSYTDLQFNVPDGYNQAPLPHIKIEPPVPGMNQPITLNATYSIDPDHDLSSIQATWDVDNDGEYDTELSTNKTTQYTYANPGNYLVRLRMTDPSGAQTISTPVSVKIPGEKKITVESFTLIDAIKDEAVRELKDGLIIQQEAWEGKKFSVRANTSSGKITRVVFSLKGPIVHQQTDRKAPYALFGDHPKGNFVGKKLLVGKYSLTATPFNRLEKGVALTVNFEVKEKPPAQPSIAWDKTLGGMSTDMLRDAISTPDGGFILAGYSTSDMSGDKSENGRGGGDYWVVKIDAQHNKQWDKTFGGNGNEDFNSIISTHDGGYLLGGASQSDISGDKTASRKGGGDYWTVKIDSEGNKIWDKAFGGSGHDLMYDMISTQDGGYLLGGFSESNVSGDKSDPRRGAIDYWVVKIDGNGNKVWDKTFGGSSVDQFRSLASTDDGYLIGGDSRSGISGDKTSASNGEEDYWVIKIDLDGNKLWDKTYGGNSYEKLMSIASTTDGGYMLGGFSNSSSSGDKSENSKGGSDLWIVRIDSNGNKVWDKTLGGNNSDVSGTILLDPDGGYLLSGTSASDISGDKSENSVGNDDYWVLKIDDQGNKEWDKTIGGTSLDNNATAVRTLAGNYLIAGYSGSSASGDKTENSKGEYDYWVVELKEPITPVAISFTLINAQTDQEIKELNDADTIRLTDIATRSLDIRANVTAGNITRVVFDLNGPVKHNQIDRQAPYALFGDQMGNFNGGNLLPGNYTLKVTAFNKNVKVASVIISFTVNEGLGVISFTLIDATLDKPLRTLVDGDVIDLTLLEHHKLAIKVDTEPMLLEKVDLVLQGPTAFGGTQWAYPYVLFGDFTCNGVTDYHGGNLSPGAYTLFATPYLCGRKGNTVSISFEVTKSRDDVCGRVQVYPIPASEVVNIRHEGITGNGNMTLLDLNGNVLISRPLSQQPTEQLDVRQFQGTYYLKISSPEGTQTIRVIIN